MYYNREKHNLSININNDTYGSASGAGEYKYGNHTLYQLGIAPKEAAATELEVGNGLVEGIDYMTEPEDSTKPEATKTDEEKIEEFKKQYKPKYQRGIFGLEDLGPIVALGMQAAGIGKPNYNRLNAAVDSAGTVHTADWMPIGDYLRYRPMDIWFEQNKMDANARATDRAILNSGANQGSKMAGLLANGYNSQLADGELYRKELEYNDAQREKVAAFNRGTNQFNAENYTKNSQFNAAARNQAAQHRSSLALQAAAQQLDADAGWYNSLYGNMGNIFKGIGAHKKENRTHNIIADMAANGLFGVLTPESPIAKNYLTYVKAEGGKTNRKKGKKGLTY